MGQGIQCWVPCRAPENLTAFRHVQRVGRDGGKVEKESFDMSGNIGVILK
jgi:hypothetical protein